MKSMEKTKELSQFVWEPLHATFLNASTSAFVSQLSTGEDGDILEPSFIRWVETQYLGPPKFEDIEDLSSEMENERQKQDKIGKSWH